MSLTFILAETALEIVPKSISGHKSVVALARTKGKQPEQILLDRTYHHKAMLGLSNAEKRGRPDIAHRILLGILSTPLNKEEMLKTFIHTRNDYVIQVNEKIRLPRNYDRFVGLMEKLFLDRRVPIKGIPLLTLEKMCMNELIQKIQPTRTVAFSTVGTPTTINQTCRDLVKARRPTVIVGGFAHGHFSNSTCRMVDALISIYDKPLDAWVVASRIIYQYEVELWSARNSSHKR